MKKTNIVPLVRAEEIRETGCIMTIYYSNPICTKCIEQDSYYIFDGELFRDSNGILRKEDNLFNGEEYKETASGIFLDKVRPEKTHPIIIAGNSKGELFEIFFRERNKVAYGDSVDIVWNDEEIEKEYEEFFYGEKGLEYYLQFGGVL